MQSAVTASSAAAMCWATAMREARAGFIGDAVAQAPDRAACDCALHTGRDQGGEGAERQQFFGRAERTGMPEIGASQDRDDGGAHFVRIGRPFLYAAIAGGEPGVQRVINLMHAGIDRDLALLGIRSLSEITPDLVRKF
jgi:hypothetical protein